jgi:hypothetical protein
MVGEFEMYETYTTLPIIVGTMIACTAAIIISVRHVGRRLRAEILDTRRDFGGLEHLLLQLSTEVKRMRNNPTPTQRVGPIQQVVPKAVPDSNAAVSTKVYAARVQAGLPDPDLTTWGEGAAGEGAAGEAGLRGSDRKRHLTAALSGMS